MSTKFTNITISNYSSNSIAVEGETKKYKEDLKKLGGKYNANLKNGPGWIFSKSSEKDVISFINGGKRLVSEDEEKKANELSKQRSKEWNEKQTLNSKAPSSSLSQAGDRNSEQGSNESLSNDIKTILTKINLMEKALNMLLSDDQKKQLNKQEKSNNITKKAICIDSDDSDEDGGIVHRKRLLR
jgi:hypothetical protein